MENVEVDTVAALIAGIEKMLADETVVEAEYLTDGYSDELPESVRDVCYFLAPEALIVSSGRPNFEAHARLKAAGYEVSCGERDSFGWLTGLIHTPKGLIMYG
jgi:hypothetical protein